MKTSIETDRTLSFFEATPGKHLILKSNAPTFTIVAVSDDYIEAAATKKENIVGRGIFEVFPDNAGNSQTAGVKNLDASLEYVVQHKREHKIGQQQGYDIFNDENSKRHLKVWSVLNKPLLDEKGELIYIIHSVKDVTGRAMLKESKKKAVKDANKQKKLLFDLFMNAPVAVAILQDINFVYEFVNERMLEYLGRTREQVIEKPVFKVLPETAGQGFEELLTEVVATGKRYAGNETLVNIERNGQLEETYINFLYEPYYDDSNEYINGVIVVVNDITNTILKQKAAEEENAGRYKAGIEEKTNDLQKANQQLERTNNQLKEFAYAASHDLQEPLRKINTFINLIINGEKENLSDKGKVLFQKVIAAAERMNLLINDLFVLSQISNYNHLLEEVDLDLILQKVTEDLSLEIEKSGAIIHKGNFSTIHGIPRQIQQLFQNLLSNSIKYAKKEEPPVIHIKHELIITSEQPQYQLLQNCTYCKIVFEDNGVGFNQEYAEKVFQMFYRLHGKSEYSGTGIGLAICRRIAENHQGAIIAESEEGKGTKFEVYLKC